MVAVDWRCQAVGQQRPATRPGAYLLLRYKVVYRDTLSQHRREAERSLHIKPRSQEALLLARKLQATVYKSPTKPEEEAHAQRHHHHSTPAALAATLQSCIPPAQVREIQCSVAIPLH